MVTHVFSNFQVRKTLGKKLYKENQILHFSEMSAFETELRNMSITMSNINPNPIKIQDYGLDNSGTMPI